MEYYSISNFAVAILVTFFVLFHPCKSAVMEVPEDVTRLEVRKLRKFTLCFSGGTFSETRVDSKGLLLIDSNY